MPGQLLDGLSLTPPRSGQVRRGIVPIQPNLVVARGEGDEVLLPLPLFLDAAPWHTWPAVIARRLAQKLSDRGITVSALESELGPRPAEDAGGNVPTTSGRGPWRMLPYRNERYGLASADFDVASVVDMQLCPPRDASGRFAYSASRLARWEASPDDQPLSGGGWVPAMTLPPDVPDLHSLHPKIRQLRRLAPRACVVLSVGPEWLAEDLPVLLAAGGDALLVRLNHVQMSGLALVEFFSDLMQRLRQIRPIPLWLALPCAPAPAVCATVDDAVKVLALGASAVAVDAWMPAVFAAVSKLPAPSPYASDPMGALDAGLDQILTRLLDPALERFLGLYSSLTHGTPKEMISTFDPALAQTLNVRYLGPHNT